MLVWHQVEQNELGVLSHSAQNYTILLDLVNEFTKVI